MTSMRRIHHMACLVNTGEKVIIDDAADAAGLSASSYLRTSALTAAARRSSGMSDDAIPVAFTEGELELLGVLGEQSCLSLPELTQLVAGAVRRGQQILQRASDMTAANRVIEASRTPA